MKVYFCGAHSTGKSTLCRYVSEKYNLDMIPEVARMILSETELQIDALRSDIGIVDTYQTRVFERQIDEEKKQKSFVSDRSLIDCLAYSAQHSTLLPILFQDSNLQQYVELLNNKKTFIFFVRPSHATLKNDGVRESISWDGVIAIDAMIKILLEMFGVRYFQINADSMQERVRLIDAVLSMTK
jgi:predicted ATPase